MISIGAVMHDTETNSIYGRYEANINEIFPRDPATMTDFWQDNLDAWEHTLENRREPFTVLSEFEKWIVENAEGKRPVFVAAPVGFDWGFVNYYFMNHHGMNPFGYSPRCLSSVFPALTGDIEDWNSSRSGGSQWSKYFVEPTRPHYALDDALAQARTLQKVIEELRA